MTLIVPGRLTVMGAMHVAGLYRIRRQEFPALTGGGDYEDSPFAVKSLDVELSEGGSATKRTRREPALSGLTQQPQPPRGNCHCLSTYLLFIYKPRK